MYEAHAEAKMVLLVPVERFHAMFDNMKRFNHYLSLNLDPSRILRYRTSRVKVSLPVDPAPLNGTMVITILPSEGQVTFFEQREDIPWERIEEIQFVQVREEGPVQTPTGALDEVRTLLHSMAPDSNVWSDGQPRDRGKYLSQISTKIPTSQVWQEAAADAYVANIPTPTNPSNILLAADPPLVAAYLMTIQLNRVAEATDLLVNTMEKYFEVYVNAEKLNPTIKFPWWKKNVKVMSSGYRALGMIAAQCQAQGEVDYENVRPAVFILRHQLGVMFRRTNKKPSKPCSLDTDSPAWWHKEYEEYKKATTGNDEQEVKDAKPTETVPRRRKKPFKRFKKNDGGDEGQTEQTAPEAPPPEEPPAKKKFGGFKPLASHNNAVRDQTTGKWKFSK